MNPKHAALIVTDIQNDFCPGGALAVNEGNKIIPVVNEFIHLFYRVVATQDWHPIDHISFASSHRGKKPFDSIDINGYQQTLWPDHCVQGTKGADFHPDLNTRPFSCIIHKGTHPNIDSYSTFIENDGKTTTGLDGYLKSLGIKEVFLCGLATDFCVLYSALDAAGLGYKTFVILDACKGIDVPAGSIDAAIARMKQHGVVITASGELKK